MRVVDFSRNSLLCLTLISIMQKRIRLTQKLFTLTHWALGLNDPYFGSPSKTDGKIFKLISRTSKDLTFIDVGAFRGDMTRLFKEAFPLSEAILIEPNKELEEHLNFEFPEDKVMAIAISPKGMISYFLDLKNPGQSGEVFEESVKTNSLYKTIQAKTLTKIMDDCKRESSFIIKVDVEGFELEVLSTIEDTTFKQVSFLWVEITPDGALRGSSMNAIRKMIPDDFDMYRIIPNGLLKIENNGTDHWSSNSSLFQNLFFARRGLLTDSKKPLIKL